MQTKNAKISSKLKLIAIAASASAMFLSGCTVHQPSFEPTGVRNKITVAETVERLELYTQPGGLNLSARDQDAVTAFLHQYGRSGQGPLYVNIPAFAAEGMGVNQTKNLITSRLNGIGISNAAVQMGQYPANPQMPAPVVVSFRRLTTAPINCSQGDTLTLTGNNQPYGNFGCAQTANLAAMIDDPRQLLAPYDFDNVPAIRRATVLDKYNAGEATGTPRPDEQVISAGGN